MSRVRASDPTPAAGQPVTLGGIGLGSIVLFQGSDGQIRPALVTFVWDQNSVHAVVFGNSHDDSEAGLKCGLFRQDDHWVAG